MRAAGSSRILSGERGGTATPGVAGGVAAGSGWVTGLNEVLGSGVSGTARGNGPTRSGCPGCGSRVATG